MINDYDHEIPRIPHSCPFFLLGMGLTCVGRRKSEMSKRWMVGWAVEDWILERVGWGSRRKGHVMGEVMNANVIGAVTCLAIQGSYLYLLTKQQQNNTLFCFFGFSFIE